MIEVMSKLKHFPDSGATIALPCSGIQSRHPIIIANAFPNIKFRAFDINAQIPTELPPNLEISRASLEDSRAILGTSDATFCHRPCDISDDQEMNTLFPELFGFVVKNKLTYYITPCTCEDLTRRDPDAPSVWDKLHTDIGRVRDAKGVTLISEYRPAVTNLSAEPEHFELHTDYFYPDKSKSLTDGYNFQMQC